MKTTRLILLACLFVPLCRSDGQEINSVYADTNQVIVQTSAGQVVVTNATVVANFDMAILPALTNLLAQAASPPLLQEEFESGAMPSGWNEWDGGSHPASWNYTHPALAGASSAAFSDINGLDYGAFYTFAQTQNALAMSFMFQCSQYPQNALEVCDLYDPNGDEICDAYLLPSGYLLLSVGGSPDRFVYARIPANTPIRIWLHYATGSTSDTASLAWGFPGTTEPTNGAAFASAADSTYLNTPVKRFLFGPVYGSTVFVYDDVICRP